MSALRLLPSVSGIISQLRTAGCVYAEEEAALLIEATLTPAELATAVLRRVAGFPLEHILGWAEFCGLRIAVDPGVFVPRRRTEFLVTEAIPLLGKADDDGGRSGAVVVDLCCGSGAVGAALAAAVAGIELHAADIDPDAVRCARRNIVPAGGWVHEGDLYHALPATLKGRVDVLVVNAPYVPTSSIGTMPQEARLHEPRVSLDGGPDGLDIHRRVAAAASDWLAPGGHLLIETSARQAARTSGIVAGNRFGARVVSSDQLDATVVIGTALS
ncbi:putative protein N(5)-glutamine methyltransferase [Pseudarthrobacter sp. N5]|uniref:putative protein N(5)-glutamine methyltransferase n=1 Tax=Pseudarthrobacter sp. N5 TaxID=3418416 RepID=UPI003CFA0441